ncbi:zinc-binding dehydrogenase [Streptomyces noursei]|uniref:zinc-binding dehydrogenase n=1 Tax=Streptomyces noursei TaxID=1971 RepID=UPI0033DF70FE
MTTTQLKANPSELVILTEYVEQGALRPVIDQSYPVEAIAKAHRSIETERGVLPHRCPTDAVEEGANPEYWPVRRPGYGGPSRLLHTANEGR